MERRTLQNFYYYELCLGNYLKMFLKLLLQSNYFDQISGAFKKEQMNE